MLKGLLEVDVAIIGAGVTGLSTALRLKQAGKSVYVFDRNRVGSGETQKSTAHLTEVLDARYQKIIKTFGLENARQVARAKQAAIETIEQTLRTHGIDAAFRRVPGFLFSERRSEMREIQDEVTAARKVSLPVSFVRESGLPFRIAGAMRIENQAELNPTAYVQGLSRAFLERCQHDCRLFEHTAIHELKVGEPCELRTDDALIRARHVVLATHTPVSFGKLDQATIHTRQIALRTYVLSFDAPDVGGLYWDLADPYHYIRTMRREDGRVRLIVGGEDHRTGDATDTRLCFESLKAYARSRFGAEKISEQWSGQVYATQDGLPYIGREKTAPQIYLATGFNGNGITFGTLSAMIISDQILGRANPWEKLFAPSRLSFLRSPIEFLRENLHSAVVFIQDRLRSPDRVSLAQLRPGEGGVVEHEGKKIGAYRREDGELETVSITCQHLNCSLRFNSAERSWDCPCHGSRYSAEGRVLIGPTVHGLQRVAVKEETERKEEKKRAA